MINTRHKARLICYTYTVMTRAYAVRFGFFCPSPFCSTWWPEVGLMKNLQRKDITTHSVEV